MLGAEHSMSKPGRQNRRTLWIVLVSLTLSGLFGAFACFHSLSSPDGAYFDPGFGLAANGYLLFEHGQYRIRTSNSVQFVSTYSTKGRDVLVFHNSGGRKEECVFRATLLGLKLHDPSIRPESDRFLFRRGFSWLPRAWGWIELHLL